MTSSKLIWYSISVFFIRYFRFSTLSDERNNPFTITCRHLWHFTNDIERERKSEKKVSKEKNLEHCYFLLVVLRTISHLLLSLPQMLYVKIKQYPIVAFQIDSHIMTITLEIGLWARVCVWVYVCANIVMNWIILFINEHSDYSYLLF